MIPIRSDHIPYANKLIAKENIFIYLDTYVKWLLKEWVTSAG